MKTMLKTNNQAARVLGAVSALCFVAISPILLTGCGGGGHKSGSSASPAAATGFGRATLSIRWPARAVAASRLIPDLSNSIRVTIVQDGKVVTTRLVARPSDVTVPSVVTFDPLPIGTVTLQASAFPNADGTGIAQSFGSATFDIADAQVTDFGLVTLNTTIDTIVVAPPAGGSASVPVDYGAKQWTATTRDAANAIVLVNPDKQSWESSDPSVATVDAKTGLVTPVRVGTTTIKETDNESGKSGRATFTVVPRVDVVVTVPTTPVACQSILVEVISGGTIVAPTTSKPYSTVTGGTVVAKSLAPHTLGENSSLSATVPAVPAGAYQIRATAYPTADGKGYAQAIGAVAFSVQESAAAVTVPVSSTITNTLLNPRNSNALGIEIDRRQTVQLSVSAYNSSFPSIVTLPSQFSWVSDNPAAATVSASGLVTGVKGGRATITCTETESGKQSASTFSVVGSVVAQFKPSDYAANGIAGDLTANDGHSYQFDTSAPGAPTLTDTTTGSKIADGQYVTQTVNSASGSVSATYAVFAFTGDLHIGAGSQITSTGSQALVLLTQGNALLDGGALVDVSAVGATPGVGGSLPGKGLGAGKYGTYTVYITGSDGSRPRPTYGGGGFGGNGGSRANAGNPTIYGADLAGLPGPYLQGGSGGYNTGETGGAGGGALYLAAQGTLTIDGASVKAVGGKGVEGGSGGAIVLLGGGGVTLTATANVNAGGGAYNGAANHGGGGGGRIVVGYGVGETPLLSPLSAAGGSGNLAGGAGKILVDTFGGF